MQFPSIGEDVLNDFLHKGVCYKIDSITFRFEIDSEKDPEMFSAFMSTVQFDKQIAERLMIKMAESALFENSDLKSLVTIAPENANYTVFGFEVKGYMLNAVGVEKSISMYHPYENDAVRRRTIFFSVKVSPRVKHA